MYFLTYQGRNISEEPWAIHPGTVNMDKFGEIAEFDGFRLDNLRIKIKNSFLNLIYKKICFYSFNEFS
jgi:hypothetical protein